MICSKNHNAEVRGINHRIYRSYSVDERRASGESRDYELLSDRHGERGDKRKNDGSYRERQDRASSPCRRGRNGWRGGRAIIDKTNSRYPQCYLRGGQNRRRTANQKNFRTRRGRAIDVVAGAIWHHVPVERVLSVRSRRDADFVRNGRFSARSVKRGHSIKVGRRRQRSTRRRGTRQVLRRAQRNVK